MEMFSEKFLRPLRVFSQNPHDIQRFLTEDVRPSQMKVNHATL